MKVWQGKWSSSIKLSLDHLERNHMKWNIKGFVTECEKIREELKYEIAWTVGVEKLLSMVKKQHQKTHLMDGEIRNLKNKMKEYLKEVRENSQRKEITSSAGNGQREWIKRILLKKIPRTAKRIMTVKGNK